MKIAKLGEIAWVSCIIDYKDMQVWLRQFSLNLNAKLYDPQVMTMQSYDEASFFLKYFRTL